MWRPSIFNLFLARRDTKKDQIKRRYIGAEESAFRRNLAVEENANEGSTDEHTGDESSVFFVVKGCPTASNDMLVRC